MTEGNIPSPKLNRNSPIPQIKSLGHFLQTRFIRKLDLSRLNDTALRQRVRKRLVDIVPCYTPRRSKEEPLLTMSDVLTLQDLPQNLQVELGVILNMTDRPHRPIRVDSVDSPRGLCGTNNRHVLDRDAVPESLAFTVDDARGEDVAPYPGGLGCVDYVGVCACDLSKISHQYRA